MLFRSKDPRVQAAIDSYGSEGDANGVAVASGKLGGNVRGQVSAGSPAILAGPDGKSGVANVVVTFDPRERGQGLVITAAHEGQHVLDRQSFVGAAFGYPNAFDGPLNITRYQTEFNLSSTRKNGSAYTFSARFAVWG